MKSYPIIIATFTERDEVLTCPGSYITMKLNVQITVCCVQLNIAFLGRILLDFDVFKFIFCDRIIRGGGEGS